MRDAVVREDRDGPLGAEPAIENEDAHEAVRIAAEVGRVERGAVRILGGREARAVEQPFRRDGSVAEQVQIDRDQHRTRLRDEAHCVAERRRST